LVLDSKDPTIPLEQYAYNETRFKMLLQSNEERAEKLMQEARHDVKERWEHYRLMAAEPVPGEKTNGHA
jgi:pyruvate-ferredoxin/flavodoxin oxidoreductase